VEQSDPPKGENDEGNDASEPAINEKPSAANEQSGISEHHKHDAKQFVRATLRFCILWISSQSTAVIQSLDRHGSAVTATATVAIAFLTAFLAWYASGQLSIMRGQLDEMRVDQRPWVRPQIVRADKFIVEDSKLSFGVIVQFINSGKSPAFNIDYWDNVVAADYPRLLLRQGDMCRAAENASASTDERIQRNFTIFPGDNGDRTFNFGYEGTDVNQFDVTTAGTNKVIWIDPVIIGCVTYRYFNDTAFHHTWFAYELGQIAPTGEFARVIHKQQTIDAINVRVKAPPVGWNKAD
jgi:hypothetical protein